MSNYAVKDSGKRQQFSGGMVRDVTEDKVNYALVFDGPMLRRWAEHLTKGAKKYSPRNWMKAEGEEELERFKESAARHFIQWFYGENEEDHAAAVYFNLNGYEMLREKMQEEDDANLCGRPDDIRLDESARPRWCPNCGRLIGDGSCSFCAATKSLLEHDKPARL